MGCFFNGFDAGDYTVREVLQAYDDDMTSKRTQRERAQIVMQGIVAVLLVAALPVLLPLQLLLDRCGRQRQDRRDEGDVEGNQDVVGNDPTFLEGGPLDPVLLVHTQC